MKTKPKLIKFENKKSAELFYYIALKNGLKPTRYAPTKDQPFDKVVIHEKI